MTDIKLLKETIRRSGLKKGYIAEKLGVTPSTFSALLNNKSEFKASQISTICKILNIRDNAEVRAIFFNQNGA